MPFRLKSMQYGDGVAVRGARSQRHGKIPLPKLTTAALIAFIGKALPTFLFNRGLYRLTKKDCCADFYSDDAGLGMVIG